MRTLLSGVACWVVAAALPAGAPAQVPSAGVLELRFTPTDRAQLALWVETLDGEHLRTLRLTEAVAHRGIGNRPGASQMNSGFRWPYGRREGVLPIWATRRASAPGAELFKRVIFQDRTSEGLASRTSNDHSPDDYYCLSFNRALSKQDALDAVSCASPFNSDKGRFINRADVAGAYSEPYEPVGTTVGVMRPLDLMSLYPPRRDIDATDHTNIHSDAYLFADHSREVMPEIDAVTMATPQGGVPQAILVEVPTDWSDGDYRACLEINVEGDYNETFNAASYPTPLTPAGVWDSWATGYGYPFRGQPSVVYCTEFSLGAEGAETFSSAEAIGSAASWDLQDPAFGQMAGMSGMTDDPDAAPGSGADRLLRMDDGQRLTVVVKPPLMCRDDVAPGAVSDLTLMEHADELHAHQWASMAFRAAADDVGVYRYEVRVSTEPIVDEASFQRGLPAKDASIEAEELVVPTDTAAGEMIEVDIGGLVQETHYYVAVRAVDGCAASGGIEVAEITTPKRVFQTVSACFVASAAWGTPLADEVGALRRLRDRYLLTNAPGRALVDVYYAVGPSLAGLIGDHEALRALTRGLLRPVVEFARALDD